MIFMFVYRSDAPMCNLSVLLSSNQVSTHDMVTVSGNNPAANSSGQSNSFRTPVNPRARETTGIALGARSPQGTVMFMQHYQNRRLSEPLRSPQWRDFLSDMPPEINPAAPAQLEWYSSIRLSDIYKLSPKVNAFDGHRDKFSLTFDLHSNLHSIHTC